MEFSLNKSVGTPDEKTQVISFARITQGQNSKIYIESKYAVAQLDYKGFYMGLTWKESDSFDCAKETWSKLGKLSPF